jgi:hypothetical protein
LLLYSSHLPLGVPNGLDIQLGTSYFLVPSTSNQALFWRRCQGRSRRLLRGEFSHAHPLLCFKFCFTLFLLALFYQKYKKLVHFIVVIFAGLLLSCFIMLYINGWFL